MDALVFNVPSSEDSPEIAAYKLKVREVAQDYAKRHGLCSVVDDALRDVGIDPKPKTAKINVVSLFGNFQLNVDPMAYQGKTATEQAQLVLDQIGTIKIPGTANGLKPSLTTIVDMEILEDVPDPAKVNSLRDAGWAFIGHEGRVRHYFPNLDVTRNGEWNREGYNYTACNEFSYRVAQPITSTSREIAGAFCLKCSNRHNPPSDIA